MVNPCATHNLPQNIICVGELCTKRIGCQLCINKHEHKFYLDAKVKQKELGFVQEQLTEKVQHLKKYTKSNVQNLRLDLYRQRIEAAIAEEQLYFTNKINEQIMNFNLWIERVSYEVKKCLSDSKEQIIRNWEKYNRSAQKQLSKIQQYEKLNTYFKEGDWTTHDHVEKSINFLYSEQLLFKFNKSLDSLKKVINHHKKEDKYILEWYEEKRTKFVRTGFCPHEVFQEMMKQFQGKPQVTQFNEPKTKQQKDNEIQVMKMVKADQTAVLIYPQIIYQPFHNVNKLIRYDNHLFATSGGRAVNLWTRVSMTPEKTYNLNFPSYGLLSFVQFGKDDPEHLVFGKSNGEMGLIDIGKEICVEMPAHEAAIRDIIQFDSYHFLTASQDWTMKLWAMNEKNAKNKCFAAQRLKITGHSGKLHTICKFGPSVLAAGADGTIKLWDIIRQSYDEVFPQEKQIYSLAQLRPELFASGGQIKEVRVWDYRKIKAPVCRIPINSVCNSILRYDSNTLLFSDKNSVKVVDIRNFREPLFRMKNSDLYTHNINSMAFLSDNEIGMGGSDNFISVWKY